MYRHPKFREKLKELLGLDLIEKCDLDFLQEEVKELDEYTQIRFSFQSEPGYYVPAIGLLVWDVSRMIDVLGKQFPMLDMDNVYCMGNSGGGTVTFYAEKGYKIFNEMVK